MHEDVRHAKDNSSGHGASLSHGMTELILSPHATREHATWVISQIDSVILRADVETRINIWRENATNGAPLGASAFQQVIPACFDEIAKTPSKPEIESLLLAVFDDARRSYLGPQKKLLDDPSYVPPASYPPFSRSIREGIFAAQSRHSLRVFSEDPPFESWRYLIAESAYRTKSFLALQKGNTDLAITELVNAARCVFKSSELRDDALAKMISKASNEEPTSIQIVVRGAAHDRSLKSALLKEGLPISPRLFPDSSYIGARYIEMLRHTVPDVFSAKHPMLYRVSLEELVAVCVASRKKVPVSELSSQILEAIGHSRDKDLERWKETLQAKSINLVNAGSDAIEILKLPNK